MYLQRIMSMYRVYPTLWDGQGCMGGQTVYAIDRTPAALPTACSSRPRADPATTWDSPTFQRLLPSTMSWGIQAVTWATLPAWISYAASLGYTLAENTSLGKLKPHGDLWIVGP